MIQHPMCFWTPIFIGTILNASVITDRCILLMIHFIYYSSNTLHSILLNNVSKHLVKIALLPSIVTYCSPPKFRPSVSYLCTLSCGH